MSESAKRIYNPVTGNYYPVRHKTTNKMKAGSIKGLWSMKKPKKEEIKEKKDGQ